MDGNGDSEITTPQVEKSPDTIQSISQENLDDRFPQQTMEFSNGKVSFRDIKPEIMREGGDIPIVMMAGWAMNQEVVGNTTRGLCDKGQRVIPLDIAGGATSIIGRAGNEIDRQGKLLYEWVKSQPNQKFRFAPQSMAALVVLSMVEKHPDIADQIDGVVMLSPMGLAGKGSEHTAGVSNPNDEKKPPYEIGLKQKIGEKVKSYLPFVSMYNLAARKSTEDTRNKKRPKTEEDAQIEERVMESFWNSIKHNPVKSVREISEMARANEYEILGLLKEKGIKVSIIQGAQDRLNSMQGLVENISRQAASSDAVGEENRDNRGLEKLPEGLEILETDTLEVKQEKQRKIVALKLELQKKEDRVPIDSLVFVEGGHEITGHYEFSSDIIRAFDYLSHPDKYQEELIETQKRNEELSKLKIEEEGELEKTRQALLRESAK